MNGRIFSFVIIAIISVVCVQSLGFESRIVNGTPSDYVEYVAYIVSYYTKISKSGTGTVISQEYVLTAANMIHGQDSWYVYWGCNDWETTHYSYALDAICHPEYNPETFENDIGLIQISPKETVEEISLPPALGDFPSINEQGDVRGFGYINVIPFRFTGLVHTSYPSVIEKDTCKELLGIRSDLVTNSHFCAMDSVQNSSICLGDEGAGFIVNIDRTKTVVGVVSFHTNMCNPNFPAAYTRVSPYVDWILSVIDYK